MLHGHIMLNGRKTNVPSAMVKSGDNMSVRSQSQKNNYFKALRQNLDDRQVPRWLNLDASNMTAQVLQLPSREDIDVSLNEQLVVEYYSR